jgi:hypothetical protein
MQLRNKIQVIAENLRKITRQKFVAIRKGDHEQAKNLQGVQLELDLQLHLLGIQVEKIKFILSCCVMDVSTILIISSIVGIIRMIHDHYGSGAW